jgi:hypothetical protein
VFSIQFSRKGAKAQRKRKASNQSIISKSLSSSRLIFAPLRLCGKLN